MLRANWMISVLLSVLLLSACSPNKVTVENYGKLDWTTTREQVYALLGPPADKAERSADSSGNTTIETWNGKDQDLITITFVDGKIAMKSMRSNGKDY